MTKTKITEITEEYEGEKLIKKTTSERTIEDYKEHCKEHVHACGCYSEANISCEGTPTVGIGIPTIQKGIETY